MLPADLATYLSNLLTGLLAHQCARVVGKMKETKGRGDNNGNNECIRDRPVRSYVDYRLIVGKEKILNSAIFVKFKIKPILVIVRIDKPHARYEKLDYVTQIKKFKLIRIFQN